MAEKTLPLFGRIENYDPSTDWLDGASPRHPFFDNPTRLASIINEIKNHVAAHLLTGVGKLLALLSKQDPTTTTSKLQEILVSNPSLWLAVLSAQKFGVIYWLSRADARDYLPLVRAHQAEAQLIDGFLSANNGLNGARIFRYAVRRVVQDGQPSQHSQDGIQKPRDGNRDVKGSAKDSVKGDVKESVKENRKETGKGAVTGKGNGKVNMKEKWLTVTHRNRFIPPNAVSCTGNHVVAVRAREWMLPADYSLFLSPEDGDNVAYDLHDFAHLTAAILSPTLFGSRYFLGHLGSLDHSLTQLIASPGISSGLGPKLSDGMIFSEILMGAFTDTVDEHFHFHSHNHITEQGTGQGEKGTGREHDYASLEDTCADLLSEYLLAQRSLVHLSTGTQMGLSKNESISTIQLAVLAQNKAYELPAAEIEQRIFTRGGPIGDARDILEKMNAVQRIEFLATTSQSWLYFEVRQTIKHRAQKSGYRKVAERWLQNLKENKQEDQRERELARKILENITYEDWYAGRRLDLWQVVSESMHK